MCLEEAAAAEGEQHGGRDSTSRLLNKLSSRHEGGMQEESKQVDIVSSSGKRSWRRILHGVLLDYTCKVTLRQTIMHKFGMFCLVI